MVKYYDKYDFITNFANKTKPKKVTIKSIYVMKKSL